MLNFLQTDNGLQTLHDHSHVLAVVHTQLDLGVEDIIIAVDHHPVDIYIQLLGDHLRHLVQQSDAVDTSDGNGGVEEHLLVHVPLHVDDTVAIAALQLVGHITVALVDLDPVLVVDISQGIVAGDGVTATGEDKL